jgi:uncharacterized repeat protein (TIGR03803 family)
MTNKVYCRRFAPRRRRGAARAAYGFVMVLLTVLAAAPPAPAQTLTVLYTFTVKADGFYPYAPVLRDADGNFYGNTFQGGNDDFGTVFELSKAGNETVLFSFDTGNGAFPTQPLTRDASGNLYGVALEGGGGSGVAFKLSPKGKETVLYSFQGGFNNNPKVPSSGLIMDTAGNLYGTTLSGGNAACDVNHAPYCGTVYKLAQNRKLTILYKFKGGSDGAAPSGNLLMDKAGNLYGVTLFGGDLNCTLAGATGCGVVFELDPAGKETVLYRFTGGADGAFPSAGLGLIEDADGNFYGTANEGGEFGGACNAGFDMNYGCGTVFKLNKTGKFTLLHKFSNDGTEGVAPNGGLVRDPAGNLYGTTEEAALDGTLGGTIFKVSKTGKLTVLYNFDGLSNGSGPAAGLVRDSEGNLYGTTVFGGGNVFKLAP